MKLIKRITLISLVFYCIKYLYKRSKQINVPHISSDEIKNIDFMKEFIYNNSQEFCIIAHIKNESCALCDLLHDKHSLTVKDKNYAHSIFSIGDVKNHSFKQEENDRTNEGSS